MWIRGKPSSISVKPYYADNLVTLYHGDCREILQTIAADVLVTDPPYGMALRSGWNGEHGDLRIEGDEDPALRDLILGQWVGRPALIFGRWSVARPAATRMVLTWDKGGHTGMGDLALPWKPQTEEIYVVGNGFVGARDSCVLRFNAPMNAKSQGRFHPTEKPVALMRELIAKCPPGAILDPFAGSGSTLVAAADLNRKAIGIEIEERYCEIAARRLESRTPSLFRDLM